MKIAFVGNIANNFFREAKALQEMPRISVDLYFVNNKNNNTTLPESDEPILRNNYPEWIKPYNGFNASAFSLICYLFGFKTLLFMKNKEVVDVLNSYDICVFSGPDMLFIPLIKTNTIFRATGSDLTVYPLFSYRDKCFYSKSNVVNIFTYLKQWVIWIIKKKYWRNSIIFSDYVDAAFGKPFDDAVNKLKIPKNKIVRLFRLGIDTEIFSKRKNTEEIFHRWNIPKDDFIVFMPSRLMIRKTPSLIQSGQWKASDVGIIGFNHFLNRLDEKDRSRVKLLIPERSLPTDLDLAKILIDSMKITDNVLFISGKEKQGLSRDELIDIYSASDVVMDDFGAGWYGSVAVEALSCEVPLVTYVPEHLLLEMFPWHPFQIAKSAEEICSALFNLYIDKNYAQDVGKKSRRWVIEFHSASVVSKNLEVGFIGLLGKKAVSPYN